MAAPVRYVRNEAFQSNYDERTLKEPLDFQNELFQIQQQLPLYYKFKIINETFWAGFLLLALAPLMICIALVIKIRMGSPILFKQLRIGLNGRPFYAYKFRTMRKNAPRVVDMGYKPLDKIIDDPRVDERIGRFLRKYKWDELPQLFNVVKGDMLLIGPRPYILEENYEVKRSQAGRYAIRPGISGPWQISGNLSISSNEKLILDNQYLEKISLQGDIQIFLSTLRVVIFEGEQTKK